MLTTLDRHIAITTSAAMLVVMLAMLTLLSVFNLIEEFQEDYEGYTATVAIQYVLLTLPRRFQEILPYSLFLGSLIGMGTLSSQNEITVMRAAGVSLSRIFASLALPLTAWLAIGYGISEVVAPLAEKRAEVLKMQNKYGYGEAVKVMGGHWFRDESLYMKINAIDEQGALVGVVQYWLNDEGRVQEIVHAERGEFDPTRNRWLLTDVSVTDMGAAGVEVRKTASRIWVNASNPEFIESQAFVDPEKMSLRELSGQIDYAVAQGLGDVDYRLAFWAKLMQPLSVFGLALLAVVFTVGALREVGIGARLLAGILVGLSFKYLQDLFAPMSVVYGMAPLVAVLIPIGVCWLVGLIGIRRIA